jgi:hypothetical protein
MLDHRTGHCVLAALALLASLAVGAPARAAEASFTPLGDLPGGAF